VELQASKATGERRQKTGEKWDFKAGIRFALLNMIRQQE
jgi:hypothetical protein